MAHSKWIQRAKKIQVIDFFETLTSYFRSNFIRYIFFFSPKNHSGVL